MEVPFSAKAEPPFQNYILHARPDSRSKSKLPQWKRTQKFGFGQCGAGCKLAPTLAVVIGLPQPITGESHVPFPWACAARVGIIMVS